MKLSLPSPHWIYLVAAATAAAAFATAFVVLHIFPEPPPERYL